MSKLKSNIKCPICNGDLYIIDNRVIITTTLDGNTIYHCENNEAHKFWSHPFGTGNILHLNKNASDDDFHSEKYYRLVDGSWNVC